MISRAFLELPRLVREGKVDEGPMDQAVIRSLALKYRMGLFDDPYKYCDEEKAKKEMFSERNKRDVLELTRESIVLLKNEGDILPLSTNRVVEPGDFTVFVGPDLTTANAVRITLKTR